MKFSFFLLNRVVGDVRGENLQEGGGFLEITGREEDLKRGFGGPEITPRWGEWETGRHKTEAVAFPFDLVKFKKRETFWRLMCNKLGDISSNGECEQTHLPYFLTPSFK